MQADAETAAGDLEALRTWCKQLDTSHRAHVADTSQRISHLEAGPDLAPMLAAIQQLEDRVASSSRAHEAATARLEAGLGRVNGDAAENAARLARVESSLQAVRRSLREVRSVADGR